VEQALRRGRPNPDVACGGNSHAFAGVGFKYGVGAALVGDDYTASARLDEVEAAVGSTITDEAGLEVTTRNGVKVDICKARTGAVGTKFKLSISSRKPGTGYNGRSKACGTSKRR
jgi:hypothetical protein